MRRGLARFVVGLLAFAAGVWWTGVINNPWVMSKYHRGDFIESSFALIAGAVCCGIAVRRGPAGGKCADNARVFALLMYLSGYVMLFWGMQTFISILSGGQITYDSLVD